MLLLPQRLLLPQPLPACTAASGPADTGHEVQPGWQLLSRHGACVAVGTGLRLEQHVERQSSPGWSRPRLRASAQQLPSWPPPSWPPPIAFAAASFVTQLPPPPLRRPPGRSRLRSSSSELAITASAVPTSTSTAPHSVNLPIAASTSTATCAEHNACAQRRRLAVGRQWVPGLLLAPQARLANRGLAASSIQRQNRCTTGPIAGLVKGVQGIGA